ncbi:MAG: iron-sulfur cluster assembly scaffold protein [Chlamydiia bacterium]|nr:iron-sulfur cluster assembly scaffold protein [Chlamydiia bacterium]
MISPSHWTLYSRKLATKIDNPRSAGHFTEEDATERGVHFASGQVDKILRFTWLVDQTDGTILDCRFEAFGPSALIGAAEVAAELLIGKNYDQARRITADLIDQQVADRPNTPAFPKEAYPFLNLVLEGIDHAAAQCTDLPLPQAYVAPPAPMDIGEVLEGGYPGYETLTKEAKLSLIEQVLDRDVRPYIALDAGGVNIVNLLNDKELIISYEGTCTSCFSAVGTTLSYIQQIVRAKVHPDLVVIPNME